MSDSLVLFVPNTKILFRAAIAAVSDPDVALARVYTLDIDGRIRESQVYNGQRHDIAPNDVQPFSMFPEYTAKIGSSLAAIASKGLENIHIFYISPKDDKIRELVYEKKGNKWSDNTLSMGRPVNVAPYSKLAAMYMPRSEEMRLFAQLQDDTIQVFTCSGTGQTWQAGQSLEKALPGSAIASTAFDGRDRSIRVYFQGPDKTIIEHVYDKEGWHDGPLHIPNVPPRAALAATSWKTATDTIELRLYYAAAGDMVLEKKCVNAQDKTPDWAAGKFEKLSIPGSEIAAIHWGFQDVNNLRVYFQDGLHDANVCEWAFKSPVWALEKSSLDFN